MHVLFMVMMMVCLSSSPEPNLTPENLSKVLDLMGDRLWLGFGYCVNIPHSEVWRIHRQCSSDRERKQAVIPYLISNHPALSWVLVARALYQVVIWWGGDDGGGGDSCHRALELLQQLFPTGIYIVRVYCTLFTDSRTASNISVFPALRTVSLSPQRRSQ